MRIDSYISTQLIENSIDGVWVIDPSHRTIYVNHILTEMLGYSQEEIIGKAIPDFMRPDEGEDLNGKLELRKVGVSEHHEIRLITKTGASLWVSCSCSPLHDDHNQFMGAVGIITDINERRKTELILAAQKSVFEILIRGGSLEDALTELLKPVELLVDGVLASILLMDEEGRHLYHGASLNLSEEYNEYINGKEIGPKAGSCGTSAFTKKLVITDDITTDPRWEDYQDVALRFGLKACWSCPITTNGKVVGTFAMYFKEKRSPSSFELDVVKSISSAAALSIEHNHLYETVRKHNNEMSFLAEARMILARSMEYEDVLNDIPDLIVNKRFGDWAFICLKRDDGIFRTKTIAARKELLDIIKPVQNLEFDLSSDIGLSRAMKQNISYFQDMDREMMLPMLNSDKQGAPNPRHMQALIDLDMKSYIAVPLTVRNEVIGGMMVCSNHPQRRYREGDLSLMIEVARSCANAIDNAALYRESQRSIQAREDFISIASHELRTPLTSLKMRIDLLSIMIDKGSFPPEVQNKLYPIVSEIQPDVDKFARLIETLLDISKLGAKKLSLSFVETNLSKLLKDEIVRMNSQYQAHQTPLEVDIAENLHGQCDQVRLQQVITNLLSNALKFGHKRPVSIKARGVDDNLEIEVKDNGIGISPIDQKRIFKPFERAVSDRHFGGLGLGLYVTKQIIDGHRGNVEVHSAPGKGTTFSIKLPILTRSTM